MGCSEHGNEFSGCIKSGVFLEQLSPLLASQGLQSVGIIQLLSL
jgi:hypothetical protein